MQYSHDTLGNRTSRVRGVLTREMAQEGISTDTILQIIVPPADTIFAFGDEKPFDEDDTSTHGTLIKTKAEKEAYLKELMAQTARMMPITKQDSISRSITDYDVGAIPLQYGVSPTGARTYSIPIATAPDIKYAPQLSLSYNSQGGYGYGGYGWDLGGLSQITLAGRTLYYDGVIKAANAADTSAVFMLDGVRLVRNDDSATSSAFPLVTATGHILAAPVKNASGYVRYFNVKYPNGVSATYGSTSLNLDSQLLSYPMVESVNMDGDKIQYEYSFDSTDGRCFLTSVKYGFDTSGDATGQVLFQVTSNSYYQYYAGKKLWRKPRIDNLLSIIDGELIRYYSLNYSWKAGTPLLTSVALSKSNRNLPSLEFTYGPESPHSGADSLKIDKSLELDSYVISGNWYYKRGKFVPGSHNDGLLMYPIRTNYTIYPYSNKYRSSYDAIPVVHILAAASVVDVTDVDCSIDAGDGLQVIELVDCDGDGIDEIVQVKFGSTDEEGTDYTIKKYGFDDHGSAVTEDSFQVKLPGYVRYRNLSNSPRSLYRRAYYWGDFRGDGQTQLLAISYSTNGNGIDFNQPQTCYFSLVDLNTGAVLTEQTQASLFSLPFGEDKTVFCIDIDGDGQTELCHATPNGTYVYKFRPVNLFTFDKTVPLLSDSIIASDDTYFTDINADGYIDVIKATQYNSYWPLYINTGTGFISSSRLLDPKSSGDAYFFFDINYDGYPDLIKINGTSLGYYLNNEGNSFSSFHDSYSSVTNAQGILPANILDNKAMSGFIKVDGQYVRAYAFTAIAPEQRHLIQSRDSYGKIVRSGYRYLPNGSLYWTHNPSDISAEDGFQLRVLPIYVLSNSKGMMSDAAGAPVFQQDNYSWYDGVVNTRGLGFCGFSAIKTSAYLDTLPVSEEIWYDPQRQGVTTLQKRYFSMQSGNPFQSTTFTWDNHSTTYGKLSPRLTQSVTTDSSTGVVTTVSYTYDSFDYPTKINTARRIGSAGVPILELKDITYAHNNTTSKYVLGTITTQRVVMNRDGDPTSMLGDRSVFTYDSCYRPLSRNDYKVITHGNHLSPSVQSYLVSKSRWTYDTHGNVLTEESAPYNATEYTGNTYTYDSFGRHLSSSTDALGHTTTYSNFDRYGNPRTVTDYRGRVKTNSFDSWGNHTKSVYADGTVDSTATAWGGQGVYTVTHTVTGKPATIVHYDALSREVRSGNQRFNGGWQYTDTDYNQRGLVTRTSLPFLGTSPSLWNTYKHDNYSRRTKITKASGRVTQWSYSGTTVTETKDGITVTKTANAAGDLVIVTDAAGTITYTLRDDGQPSSVTAPGNATTSFSYDNYGRRTCIVDPSAGTRSTAYTYNNDGSSVTTETNALGSIATSVDKYGRVTGVTRTGTGAFNTTYTYDAYGRLSSVSSTNGTSHQYTLDGYDRIVTDVEYVPDNLFLRRVFSYGPGSTVSSIQYITSSGTVATENYTYSNGYNTAITLSDGTNVLTRIAENDLGLPTYASSGGVLRTYEYSAYGFPTKRILTGGGNTIQDLRTTFNPQTGNLTSRVNTGTSSNTEYFYYDALGRLNYDYYGPGAYDIKGNAIYRSGLGTMTYPSTVHPYQIERLNASSVSVTRPSPQTITYTAYDRPATISESGPPVTSFTYNASHERVKMQMSVNGSTVTRKYYIGDRYEREESPSGTTERLFLGGDAYSAPMVLQRTGSGSWTPYVIGRDYLGSITNIIATDGTSVAEYSYDAWGRMRDPETLTPYVATSQPSLLLGRGYCGHEHLSSYGLINMNARLYDPVLGRFLSPDPFVQSPDFSQNFNRYAYALNNPLKYKDPTGEFAIWGPILLSALVAAVVDYGFQVGHNYKLAKNRPEMTKKDIWFNNIDWFDVGFSGLIGGVFGGAVAIGGAGPVSAFVLKHQTSIKAAEVLITSAVDITGEGVQKVRFDDFIFRSVTGLATMAVTETISKTLKTNSVHSNTQESGGKYSVYEGIDPKTGEVKYVGITKRTPQIRWAEHMRSNSNRAGLIYKVVETGLDKQEARVMEQLMINQFGLESLYNSINSIAPKYWDLYNMP